MTKDGTQSCTEHFHSPKAGEMWLPVPGERIRGRYEILEKIGSGGFGAVFRARDLTLKKKVALKFLYPGVTANKKKFHRVRREINVSQKISDPRITRIFSLEGLENRRREQWFLVMELVEGRSLKDRLARRGVWSWEEFSPLFLDILEGVRSLHRHNIIHRDIKPSNIMIIPGNRIKLLDFGLSKEVDDPTVTTTMGEVVGSPAYISPEQLHREPVDQRSDIYQLSLVLYQALSAALPFSARSTLEMAYARLSRPPVSPRKMGVRLPRFLEYGILKGLERKKERRFASIDEMLAFYRRGRCPRFGRARRWFLSRRGRWMVLPVILVALLAAGFWGVSNYRVLDSLQVKDSVVFGQNPLGLRIWERDFAPLRIARSEVVPADPSEVKGTGSMAVLFLENPKIDLFDPSLSLIAAGADNRMVFCDSFGAVILDRSFSRSFFRNATYGFTRRFRIDNRRSLDLDGDGTRESRVFIVRHAPEMYPTALVLFHPPRAYSFSNPGTISSYRLVRARGKDSTFLVHGRNNLVGHLDFVARVNLGSHRSGIPYFQSEKTHWKPDFMVFLPTSMEILEDYWREEGYLVLKEGETGRRIHLDREGKITIPREKIEYRDDPAVLNRVYRLLNHGLRERMVLHNDDAAREKIAGAAKETIENPWLSSAIRYLLADLQIRCGQLSNGEANLERALELYPPNTDAHQRMAELCFLRGEGERAREYVRGIREGSNWFWGLSNGAGLFLFYLDLAEGDFIEARSFCEEGIGINSVEKTVTNVMLRGILHTVIGEYGRALEILDSLESRRFKIFTEAEYRLAWSRAALLRHLLEKKKMTGKGLKKLKFYLRDLQANSFRLGHLADISRLYFEVEEEGDPGKRKKLAGHLEKRFEGLLQRSRGDFLTRVWLFYDAFVYARCMELLNRPEEACRGYETCRRANPHSGLSSEGLGG